MQAALMLRSKQRIARNKLRRERLGIKGDSLPSNVATKEIPPYPRFPPCAAAGESWVGTVFDSNKVLTFRCFTLQHTIYF